MANTKWYYLCDLEEKKAKDLTQIPKVWGNITGMADLDDTALADLSWAGHPHMGFLSLQAARDAGISELSITDASMVGTELAKQQIREKRDLLLNESDKAVTVDRWEGYSDETKQIIAGYRQALRDVTNQDPFNTVFPAIPDELAYLRAIS